MSSLCVLSFDAVASLCPLPVYCSPAVQSRTHRQMPFTTIRRDRLTSPSIVPWSTRLCYIARLEPYPYWPRSAVNSSDLAWQRRPSPDGQRRGSPPSPTDRSTRLDWPADRKSYGRVSSPRCLRCTASLLLLMLNPRIKAVAVRKGSVSLRQRVTESYNWTSVPRSIRQVASRRDIQRRRRRRRSDLHPPHPRANRHPRTNRLRTAAGMGWPSRRCLTLHRRGTELGWQWHVTGSADDI